MTDADLLKQLKETKLPRLAALLEKVLEDYEAFAALPPPEDPRGFAAYQSACKAALNHLDAGLKLLAMANDTGGGGRLQIDESVDVTSLIEAAREALPKINAAA